MKSGKVHRVPLSQPALDLLAEMALMRADDASLIFPGFDPPAIRVVGHTDKNSGIASEQFMGCDGGILQRIPANLKKEPLLRVEIERFAGRDAKEGRVETIDVAEKTAPACVHFSRSRGILIVKFVETPAFGRHFADRINAFGKQSPERVGAVGAGEPAPDPNDGDWVEAVHARPGPSLHSGVAPAR